MGRIEWDAPGSRQYETGVDRGVLFPKYGEPVPWNGLVSVSEGYSGGEVESFYLNGRKYLDIVLAEDYEATLEVFSTPPEFRVCEGEIAIAPGLFATQQPRQTFSFSWRTLMGNDLEGTDFGYKLHIVYNATVEPAEKQSQTLSAGNNSIPTRQLKLHSVPPDSLNYKPTAHIVFDSRFADRLQLEDIESFLYGRPGTDARLLSQLEILDILKNVIEEPLGATI